MVSLILVSIYILIATFKCYQYMFYKPPNFPPGPPRIPVFGAYLFLIFLNYKQIHKAIDKLCTYYKSNVIGFYYGPAPVIIVNDVDSVREALRDTKLDGKPDILLAQLRTPDFITRGLFFTDGPVWHDNRRFTLRHLRDFGYGRRFVEYEMDLETELLELVSIIRGGPLYDNEKEFIKGNCVLCPKIFYACTGNALLKILTKQTVPRDQHHLLVKIGENSYEFTTKGDSYGRMFSLLPALVKFFPSISGYKVIRKASVDLYKAVEGLVMEQLRTFQVNIDRHYLDIYFNQLKKEPESKSFSLDQLVMNCTDLIMPTFSTLSAAMSFFLQRMILQPEIMQRIQNEIDVVVGSGRLPRLDDRVHMPYTEACLRELLRMETIIPSGFPHQALQKTTLSGYDVPQGAIVVTGLQSASLDKTKFDNVNSYDPERFLDSNGKLCLKKDVTMPFGAGKRLCVAETFSRNLLFLLIGALMQNFTVHAPVAMKNVKPTGKITGIVQFPNDFWVTFTSR